MLTNIPESYDVVATYGPPSKTGAGLVMANMPYDLVLSWDSSVAITRFACHKLVKPNIEFIFAEILRVYGIDRIRELNLDKFGGCWNYRKMRGGSSLSMHSWGIAVDMAPKQNRLKWGKDKAHFARPEYNDYWAIIMDAGGVSLGRQKNYDWMHWQFAKA